MSSTNASRSTLDHETHREIDHQIGPRGRLTIRQAAGSLRIRGVEGDRVRIQSDGRALADSFSVETGDGHVELRQTSRIGFGLLGRGESVDLRVDVPHGAALVVEGQSVEIEASDLSGSKSFRSASGEVSLQRLAGAVEVETVSGDVEIDGQAPLDVRARTVSGDVEVRLPSLRRLELGTTSGDAIVDAELLGEGPFTIRTISGDASVISRSGLRIEAETITGGLSADVPAKRESMLGRKVLIVGKPGPTLSFRSVSGDLQVVAAREPARTLEEEPMSHDIPGPQGAADAEAAPRDDASTDADTRRLKILRQLERGEISVAEAGERLGELDQVLS